jgi:hypothetical protein
MPVEISRPDNLQTKIFMSFVNMTQKNATTYPAVTTVRIDYSTLKDRLTSYTIYDQYAVRTTT